MLKVKEPSAELATPPQNERRGVYKKIDAMNEDLTYDELEFLMIGS